MRREDPLKPNHRSAQTAVHANLILVHLAARTEKLSHLCETNDESARRLRLTRANANQKYRDHQDRAGQGGRDEIVTLDIWS